MKTQINFIKKYLAFVLVISSVIFSACSEDVNYKADYTEDYAVYCIVDIDSAYQTAIVTKSYQVDGFDALTNKTDPSVENAQIKITSRNGDFIFSDTTAERTNNFRYDSPQKFYYLNNFQKGKTNNLKLSVTLPNGKQLSSEINIPNFSLYIYNDSIYLPLNPDSIGVTIKWNLNNASEAYYFLPRMLVFYYDKTDASRILHAQEMPVEYISQNGKDVPVYPKVMYDEHIRYKRQFVDKALIDIAGDKDRGNIIISHAIFEVNVLEENLARYYSSIKTYENSYSIKVYEPVITNIDGGFGVFGAYFKKNIKLIIEKKFFTDLGYEVEE